MSHTIILQTGVGGQAPKQEAFQCSTELCLQITAFRRQEQLLSLNFFFFFCIWLKYNGKCPPNVFLCWSCRKLTVTVDTQYVYVCLMSWVEIEIAIFGVFFEKYTTFPWWKRYWNSILIIKRSAKKTQKCLAKPFKVIQYIYSLRVLVSLCIFSCKTT